MKPVRCAIYTRKSSEEGLDQAFNSLDAQRDAGEACVASHKAEGWVCLPDRYDDGGFSGGNMERPALRRLMADIEAKKIDCVVVYKLDRLSRSLLDFARMMETFQRLGVSFCSITQSFDTSQSMGRLTMHILTSFAQYERELVSERTRDKIRASRKRGMWMGGRPVLGYDLDFKAGRLVVNEDEAVRVRALYETYLKTRSLLQTASVAHERGWTTKRWTTKAGNAIGGQWLNKCTMRALLTNVLYAGMVRHKEDLFPGEHTAIIERATFDEVQHLLRSNGATGGMHVRNAHGALLKGLLVCGPCQRAMGHTYSVKAKRLYRYYTCQGAQKHGRDACPSRSLPANQVEALVVERVKEAAVDADLRSRVLAAARGESATTSMPEVADALADWTGVWESMVAAERARAVRLVVERVEYDGSRGALRIAFRDGWNSQKEGG
ncbi:MAG: recombinase family protein [Phycisphaerales bacterium]